MKPFLAVAALALAATLASQWQDWPPPTPEPDSAETTAPAAETPQQPEVNPLDLITPLGEKDDYLEVTERPLFLSERRPPSEEPEEEKAAAPDVPSDLAHLDLNAVLITPSGSSAWVRDPKKKELLRLQPGDDLEGWSVQEILNDRVLLERQGEKDTLVLRDYKNMPPPQRKPTARTSPQKSPRAAVKRPAQTQRPNRAQSGANQQNAPRANDPRNPQGRTNTRHIQQR